MGMGLKDVEDKETSDTLIGKIEKAVLEIVQRIKKRIILYFGEYLA
jgi:hypothetical protein